MFFGGRVKKEWLLEKMTIQEAGKRSLRNEKIFGRIAIPFGLMRELWIQLKSLMKEDNELWTYSSNDDSIQSIIQKGFCIVRNGKIIHGLETRKYCKN